MPFNIINCKHFRFNCFQFQRENNDGLTYIEVSFTNDRSDRRPIIHGDQERTNYVDIDFTRKAEPLPDDED